MLIRRQRQSSSSSSLKDTGFTIVELLIVIVVIGILAAIVIVAYNGIQANATKTATVTEARQWAKLFEVYSVQYPSTPLVSGEAYCLGTGFPNGFCRGANGPESSTSYPESTSALVMTELAKVGTPPRNSKKLVLSGNVGPYLAVGSSTYNIRTFIPGTDDEECARNGMTHSWINSAATVVLCSIVVNRS